MYFIVKQYNAVIPVNYYTIKYSNLFLADQKFSESLYGQRPPLTNSENNNVPFNLKKPHQG
jgi:hypothetical protein